MKRLNTPQKRRAQCLSATLRGISVLLLTFLVGVFLGYTAASAEVRTVTPSATVRACAMPEPEPEPTTEPTTEPRYIGEFTTTFYCPCAQCCGTWADGITATGTAAEEGRTVAVDPSVIPYGTELLVYFEDGRIGRYVAEDCGWSIRGNRIDVYCDSHDAALLFGVQEASVYVVEEDRA